MTVLPVVTGFLYRLRTQTIIRQKVYSASRLLIEPAAERKRRVHSGPVISAIEMVPAPYIWMGPRPAARLGNEKNDRESRVDLWFIFLLSSKPC